MVRWLKGGLSLAATQVRLASSSKSPFIVSACNWVAVGTLSVFWAVVERSVARLAGWCAGADSHDGDLVVLQDLGDGQGFFGAEGGWWAVGSTEIADVGLPGSMQYQIQAGGAVVTSRPAAWQ